MTCCGGGRVVCAQGRRPEHIDAQGETSPTPKRRETRSYLQRFVKAVGMNGFEWAVLGLCLVLIFFLMNMFPLSRKLARILVGASKEADGGADGGADKGSGCA